jgi:hypothetical protein
MATSDGGFAAVLPDGTPFGARLDRYSHIFDQNTRIMSVADLDRRIAITPELIVARTSAHAEESFASWRHAR